MLRSCPTAVELYKNVAERGKWGELLMEAHSDHRRGRLDEALVKYLILAELGMFSHKMSLITIFGQKHKI